jgi:hypothetical protein
MLPGDDLDFELALRLSALSAPATRSGPSIAFAAPRGSRDQGESINRSAVGITGSVEAANNALLDRSPARPLLPEPRTILAPTRANVAATGHRSNLPLTSLSSRLDREAAPAGRLDAPRHAVHTPSALPAHAAETVEVGLRAIEEEAYKRRVDLGLQRGRPLAGSSVAQMGPSAPALSRPARPAGVPTSRLGGTSPRPQPPGAALAQASAEAAATAEALAKRLEALDRPRGTRRAAGRGGGGMGAGEALSAGLGEAHDTDAVRRAQVRALDAMLRPTQSSANPSSQPRGTTVADGRAMRGSLGPPRTNGGHSSVAEAAAPLAAFEVAATAAAARTAAAISAAADAAELALGDRNTVRRRALQAHELPTGRVAPMTSSTPIVAQRPFTRPAAARSSPRGEQTARGARLALPRSPAAREPSAPFGGSSGTLGARSPRGSDAASRGAAGMGRRNAGREGGRRDEAWSNSGARGRPVGESLNAAENDELAAAIAASLEECDESSTADVSTTEPNHQNARVRSRRADNSDYNLSLGSRDFPRGQDRDVRFPGSGIINESWDQGHAAFERTHSSTKTRAAAAAEAAAVEEAMRRSLFDPQNPEMGVSMHGALNGSPAQPSRVGEQQGRRGDPSSHRQQRNDRASSQTLRRRGEIHDPDSGDEELRRAIEESLRLN